jgi:hypothetical protein
LIAASTIAVVRPAEGDPASRGVAAAVVPEVVGRGCEHFIRWSEIGATEAAAAVGRPPQRHPLAHRRCALPAPGLTKLLRIPDPERAKRAIAEIQGWNAAALTERRGTPRNLDDVARSVLLSEDVTALVKKAVERSKLMSKLRDTGQFEATWAEIRCAAILARTADDDVAQRVPRDCGPVAWPGLN